jgi:hypothetical protein
MGSGFSITPCLSVRFDFEEPAFHGREVNSLPQVFVFHAWKRLPNPQLLVDLALNREVEHTGGSDRRR